MTDPRDAALRAANQQNITVGLLANLLGVGALALADAAGWAQISPKSIALLLAWSVANYGVSTLINRTQKAYDRGYMLQFFWITMVAQLPVYGFGAMVADMVRPMLLVFSMVLFGMLALRANLWQTLAYGVALGVTYVLASLLAPVVLGVESRLAEDSFYLMIWAPSVVGMAFLAEQQFRIRSRLRRQRRAIQSLLDQRVSDFRRIANDVRNPLTLVLDGLGVLLRDQPSSERLESAYANALTLSEQVDRLLQREAESPGGTREPERMIEVGAFVSGVVSAHYAAPSPRGVAVSVHAGPRMYAWVRPDGLESVLLDFLRRAVDHSPQGDLVLVTTESSANGPRIVVADSGPVSRRVHGSSEQGIEIVRSLAEGMGATLGFENPGGSGNQRFIVLRSASAPQPDTRETPTVLIDRSVLEEPSELPESYVLVIEDDRSLRGHLQEILSSQDWSVVAVEGVRVGMACVARRAPEIVVSDWLTPGIDGRDLVARLHERPEWRSIPVLMLTARADPESRLAGMTVGVDVFIGKPFVREQLVGAVRNLRRLKERERDVQRLLVRMREDVLARFLPPSLVDDIVEGRAAFDEAPKARTITTLVVDIAEFTRRTERVRAATIAEYLSDFYRIVSEVAFQNHGLVDRFFGDGVSVHYGAPADAGVEVQAERAAACARQLHRRVAELDLLWRRRLGRTLLRVGIHRGTAAVGYLGTNRRVEYTAVGRSVDVAFRIRSVASPGLTLASREVAEHLNDDDVTSVSDVEVSGVAGPLFRIGRPETTADRAPHLLVPGDTVEGYTVRQLIGKGGMAWVYEVWDPRLAVPRALKILLDRSPGLGPRLEAEGQIQARLKSDHIVEVLQAIEVRGQPALLMQMVDGCSLEELLDRYAPTADEAVAVVAAVARALARAHAQGVVHRDLKPANVLLDTAEDKVVPKVADFGLARDRTRSATATMPGQFMGTPVYAAPEQFEDASSVGPPADIWALGAILYELLTNRRAFINGPFSVVRDQVVAGQYATQHLPAQWKPLVGRMLRLDPAARPDANAVVEALAGAEVAGTLSRLELVALVRHEEPTMVT